MLGGVDDVAGTVDERRLVLGLAVVVAVGERDRLAVAGVDHRGVAAAVVVGVDRGRLTYGAAAVRLDLDLDLLRRASACRLVRRSHWNRSSWSWSSPRSWSGWRSVGHPVVGRFAGRLVVGGAVDDPPLVVNELARGRPSSWSVSVRATLLPSSSLIERGVGGAVVVGVDGGRDLAGATVDVQLHGLVGFKDESALES